jgi:hypothetical protein
VKRIEDFKGEGEGPCIVIGNGTSLLNVPPAFLMSAPSFAMNFFPMWYPFVPHDYLVITDEGPLESMLLAGKMTGQACTRFVSPWALDAVKAKGYNTDGLVPYELTDPVPGIPYADPPWPGGRYSTSLLVAAQIAVVIGFDHIYIVGFDCTSSEDRNQHVRDGRTGVPHFYHAGNSALFMPEWNEQAGHFWRWAAGRGVAVTNLSDPTLCTTLPRMSLLNQVWSP